MAPDTRTARMLPKMSRAARFDPPQEGSLPGLLTIRTAMRDLQSPDPLRRQLLGRVAPQLTALVIHHHPGASRWAQPPVPLLPPPLPPHCVVPVVQRDLTRL